MDVANRPKNKSASPTPPQWNGYDERTNRSARAEFWNLYDGSLTDEHVAPQLTKYEFFVNYEHPHALLANRSPNKYLVAQVSAWSQCQTGVERVQLLAGGRGSWYSGFVLSSAHAGICRVPAR